MESLVNSNYDRTLARLDALQKKFDELNRHIETLPTADAGDLSDIEQRIKTATAQLRSELTASSQVMASDISTQRLDPLEDRVTELETKLSQIDVKDIQQIQENYRTLSSTASDFGNQIRSVTDAVNALKSQKVTVDVQSLESQIHNNQQLIREMRETMNNMHTNQAGISASIAGNVATLSDRLEKYSKGEILDVTNLKQELKEDHQNSLQLQQLYEKILALPLSDFSKITYGPLTQNSRLISGWSYSFTFRLNLGGYKETKVYTLFPYDGKAITEQVKNPFNEMGGEESEPLDYDIYKVRRDNLRYTEANVEAAYYLAIPP